MIAHFLDYIAIERKYSQRTVDAYRDDLRDFCLYLKCAPQDFCPEEVAEDVADEMVEESVEDIADEVSEEPVTDVVAEEAVTEETEPIEEIIEEDEYNKIFGEQISEVADYAILIGEKKTKPIKEGLLTKGFDKDKIIVFNDVKEAYPYIEQQVQNDEVYALFENDLPDTYNEK